MVALGGKSAGAVLANLSSKTIHCAITVRLKLKLLVVKVVEEAF
jgi:hypothetical protein